VDVPVKLENSIRPSKTRCVPGGNIAMSKLVTCKTALHRGVESVFTRQTLRELV
jgi:hypothetical protein